MENKNVSSNIEVPQQCPNNIGRVWRWYKDQNYGYITNVSDGATYLALLSFYSIIYIRLSTV